MIARKRAFFLLNGTLQVLVPFYHRILVSGADEEDQETLATHCLHKPFTRSSEPHNLPAYWDMDQTKCRDDEQQLSEMIALRTDASERELFALEIMGLGVVVCEQTFLRMMLGCRDV